jgi:Uma2 family endonuclease
MTITEMKQRKIELGYSNEQISRLSGVPVGTIQKIFSGTTKYPRHDTLCALERVFGTAPTTTADIPLVCDTSLPYQAKKPGEYTLQDYYAVPADRRVELIDGVIYDMTAPTTIHQIIQLQLSMVLNSYIQSRGGSCIAMSAPTDVQLDNDEKTMIQPDVFVVCDRSKFTRTCIKGAPDFVIEILSPSTKKKDTFIKAQKYLDAGVREYWLVDPDRLKIIAYVIGQDGNICPTIYGFSDQVPVAIFDNDCIIDFAKIYTQFSFILSHHTD